MASEKKNPFMGTKNQIFMIPPEDLTLIKDPKHPLYDPRVEKDPPNSLIQNILLNGVIQPITVTADGTKAVVTDGRQRTKAAIEANKILRKKKAPLIKIPCHKRTGEDTDLFGVMISANEHRTDDNPLEKAEKLQRFLNLGGDPDSAAIHFGVSARTIKHWGKILDLCAAVKTAIKKGLISASAAAKLATMDAAGQKAALDELIAAGNASVSGAAGTARAKKKTNKAKLRTRAEIEEMQKCAKDADSVLIDLFKWLFGSEIDWTQYGIEFIDEEPETETETEPKPKKEKKTKKEKKKVEAAPEAEPETYFDGNNDPDPETDDLFS